MMACRGTGFAVGIQKCGALIVNHMGCLGVQIWHLWCEWLV